MMTRRRRSKLIRRKLQLRIVVPFLAVAGIAALVQAIVMNVTMSNLMADLPYDQPILLEAWPRVLGLNVALILALLVPAALAIGALVTSQVSSPIRQLEQHLRQAIDSGRPGVCRFRERDAFGEIPDLVNDAFHSVRQHAREDSKIRLRPASCVPSLTARSRRANRRRTA